MQNTEPGRLCWAGKSEIRKIPDIRWISGGGISDFLTLLSKRFIIIFFLRIRKEFENQKTLLFHIKIKKVPGL